MNSQEDTISLIVRPQLNQALETYKDRLGGEEHGLVDWASGLVAKKVDASKVAESATGAALRSAKLFQDTLKNAVGDFEIDEFTLSLAVTAEGDIGIATAGVEGSISVSFKRKAPQT